MRCDLGLEALLLLYNAISDLIATKKKVIVRIVKSQQEANI